MSRELREEVARAIFHAKYPTGTTWEQWAKQVEKRGGFDGRDWSRKLAEAALSAARPVIERETREAWRPLWSAVTDWTASPTPETEQMILDAIADIPSFDAAAIRKDSHDDDE